MTTSHFVRIFISHWRLRLQPAELAKRKKTKRSSATKMQALILIAAVVALFCVVYLLTFWLHAN